ncbi:MAG: cytochrome c biogenesis protein ResB [Isosphaeraceae bacterium]
MAKAKTKTSAVVETADREATPPQVNPILGLFDAIYRFLASLKLAVISLGLLSAALAYATYFESRYGTSAVQEWVYQTKGFAILLAFLGANILCAALIRFPWKKRQTGFVVTHAGLLVLLAGCWYAKVSSDEGQVAISEGDTRNELVRTDHPVIRVRQINAENPQEVLREWELPFHPGSFGWGPGQPRVYPLMNTFNPVLSLVGAKNPTEVLTRPKDPFQFIVKSYIPASVPAVEHVADPSGTAMARIRPRFKAPGMPEARDLFPDADEQWFTTDRRISKVVRSEGPAQFAFLYVDRPELVDDFLNPPTSEGNEGVARFRYTDKTGKSRTYDWALTGQSGKSVTLPDSDLTVKLSDIVAFPTVEAGLSRTLGSGAVPIAEFEVTRAGAAPVKHFALAGIPMFPNVIPSQDPKAPTKPLVSISYDLPPTLDPQGNGRFGVVEVLGTSDGSLAYRIWARPGAGKTLGVLKAKGPLKKGEELAAFGGTPNLPMTLSFSVDDYLTKGVEREICEPIELPKSQMGNGIAASQVEMTLNDEHGHTITQEFFIRRSNSLDPVWKTVMFEDQAYQVSFDVEREPLGFDLKLVDFDRTFDPGTEQASRFQSDVKLTDRAAGLTDKPFRISMNEPLTHRGFTFYQSSYIREQDPRTGRETGRVQSVLQVGKNPGRTTIYLGCSLVVLGTFLQFYMRAGVFSTAHRNRPEKATPARGRGVSASGATEATEPREPVLAAGAVHDAGRRADVDDDIL